MTGQKKVREIRDSFLAICRSLNKIAAGHKTVHDIMMIRRGEIEALFDGIPDEVMVGGITARPDSLREQWQAYLATADIFFELIHSRLIQSWQSFLDRMFEFLVNDHFSGKGEYPRTKRGRSRRFSLAVSLPDDRSLDDIQRRLVEAFGFLPHQQRFEQIRGALGADFSGKKESLIPTIQRHVDIRNIIQHSGGIVRQSDLKSWPDGIPGHTRSGQAIRWRVGDKVEIGEMAWAEAVMAMLGTAPTLIPDDQEE